MVFKRRTPRTWLRAFAELFWPKGGWNRAVYYVAHRLRRLPDPPHKIARGIAAGVFVCFSPFFGFHFMLAAMLAFIMQGNVVAALMATFFGNPITFPFIAAISIELGNWMLGVRGGVPLQHVFGAFSLASQELWNNAIAVFTPATAQWDRLDRFWQEVFLPYLVGGIAPGVVTASKGVSTCAEQAVKVNAPKSVIPRGRRTINGPRRTINGPRYRVLVSLVISFDTLGSSPFA